MFVVEHFSVLGGGGVLVTRSEAPKSVRSFRFPQCDWPPRKGCRRSFVAVFVDVRSSHDSRSVTV